jgi:transglutaminase-like putative cysteine protease
LSAACFQPARSIKRGKLLLFPPTKTQSFPLPDGDRGIKVTIDLMHKAASDGARDPQIRQLALQITQSVANKDYAGEIAAVYGWVKQNIRFRGEWDETIQAPEVTLKFGAGDCDDHSVLVCALLGALGYRCRFKTVAVRGEQEFTHVYAEALNPGAGQWIALDTTVDQAYPGWEPPDKSREKEWNALSGWKGLGRLRGARRLGDAVDQATADINAATPLVDAIALVNAQNYYRQTYGAPPPPSRSAVGLNYSPGSVQLTSTVPSWLWPVALIAAGLGAAMFLRDGRSRR